MGIEVAELWDRIRQAQEPKLLELQPPPELAAEGMGPIQVLVATSAQGKPEITETKSTWSMYRSHPERRRGEALMTDLASFIDHVNRFRNAESALFCLADPDKPILTAVIDYHDRVNVVSDADAGLSVAQETALARYGAHRTVYPFPLSPEWKAWRGKNDVKMSQVDFAEFLEDRVLDVTDTTDGIGENIQRMLSALNAVKMPNAADLMTLARSLSLHQEEKVRSHVNLSSGEQVIGYESSHQGQGGGELNVPKMFLIAIPVFKSGHLYRLPVRLRYRLAGGTIHWYYEMSLVAEAFENAVLEAASDAKTQTNLPLFMGTPEIKAP